MNISVEDLFPESFQRIKEEEEANRPDPNWFAHLPPEKINAYMSKYPFKSFDDIPLDNSGLQYPSRKRLVRTVLIFTESSDQLSRATDRVPGLPASPGYVQ